MSEHQENFLYVSMRVNSVPLLNCFLLDIMGNACTLPLVRIP